MYVFEIVYFIFYVLIFFSLKTNAVVKPMTR